jgi:4-oxalocrotonate tautomerase
MPLVRIDVPQGTGAEVKRGIGDAIYEAMREELGVPENDRFQVFTEHGRGDLHIDPTYLDIERSEGAIIIQVTLTTGRDVSMKKRFYRAVVDGIHAKTGMRKEDVFINLVEVTRDNWSFGNGIAQYMT